MNPSAGEQRSQTEALLLDYWYVLKKRKWVLFTFTALLMTTVTIATSMATRYYAASALIEISPKEPEVLQVDDVSEFVAASSGVELRNYYATQYKIIQSRSVMEEAVQQLREKHQVTDFDAMERPAAFLLEFCKPQQV